ncbi:MAG: efflux transporter outer membrane subunit [Phycisphaerae bacterium]|nr:efflux transporter outer membrane subunit [Phycisphaerae bacterium]
MNRIQWSTVVVLLCWMVLWGGGCNVGPDFVRPETPADRDISEQFINSPEFYDPNAMIEMGPWWQGFGDPVIADLVREALKNNYNLKAAAARVIESEALLAGSRGGRLPSVSYGGNRNRSKSSFNSPFGSRTSFYSTSYGQDLSISYITDIFGRLRRSQRAAEADLFASEATRQALVHAIIAQVVRARVQIATTRKMLTITQADIESQQDTLDITERRYSEGLVSSLDVYQARENLASAQSAMPSLEQQLQLAQHGLDVLLGKRPGAPRALPETLSDLPDLRPVPLGVPAGLLDRRPDIRAAELKVNAATERVGVSIAAMYPDLTLSGSLGYRADSFEDIFAPEGQVYSAIIALAAPIFTGGQLSAQVDAAKARVEQAAANYAETVLVAMREVEDALVKGKKLQERIALLENRLTEADRAQKQAEGRYLQGLEKILVVLNTERRRRLAQNELTLAKGDLWGARVELYLALGGQWEEVKVNK